jgi:hypothetical protein
MLSCLVYYVGGALLLVQLSASQSAFIPKNRRVLEHNEAGKCLTVSPDFQLDLQKCNL